MADGAEVWISKLQGVTSYGACGPRDVLIISPSQWLSDPEVVPRNVGKLTEKDHNRLTSEGIPLECLSDECKLMKARYLTEPSRFKDVSILNKPLKKDEVLSEIEEFLVQSTKPGVTINYFGPGRKGTGDWCFEDGFVTFTDFIHLYTEFCRGRTMELYCDCSYSGNWVQYAKDFMDEVGIQPCGHSARETGILLKVRASCMAHQVGSTLFYSARGRSNDKNTGALTVYHKKEVGPDQITQGIDFTSITCKRTVEESCALVPDFSFRRQKELDRIYLVRGKDRGKAAWHYVLLVDDVETERLFKEKIEDGHLDVADYGLILKSGWGKDPPEDVRDWMNKVGIGLETLKY